MAEKRGSRERLKNVFEACTLRNVRRGLINHHNREKLENIDFSLVSSNCNGGVMCHDLGVQFRSQFVNLWMFCNDFIRYLSDLDYYNSIDDIAFIPREASGCNYPVGLIDGMRIFFVHYNSDEEALIKWNERKKRIDKKNLFVMMSEQNGCTKEDLRAFDELPYSNKVVFTKQPYTDIRSAVYVPGFEEQRDVVTMLAYKNIFSAKRYYDDFPYVDWFNGTYKVDGSLRSRNY